ncbi:MAG: hypothetical protein KatS3mg059_1318 [Thermomicrobiales bacterium]|nr:MAG: hypothetical protein KatS3mg059_1318 [Thermomicrobiales bacterium]
MTRIRRPLRCLVWLGLITVPSALLLLPLPLVSAIVRRPPPALMPAYEAPRNVSALASPEASPGTTPVGSPTPLGRLIVHKVNEHLDPLLGACFAVWTDDGQGVPAELVGLACDNPDGESGDDGQVVVELLEGAYVLVERHAPAGYGPAPNQPFVIATGQTTELTVQDPVAGALVIHKVDQAGQPLFTDRGAPCFTLYRQIGPRREFAATACDTGFVDHDADGVITFPEGRLAGDYVLVETSTPLGYLAPPEQMVTIPAGDVLTLTISNEIGGKVIVSKTDPLGQPVTGACFQINVDLGDGQVGSHIDSACDVQEGRDQTEDGVVTLLGLDTGDYVLIEYAPPPGYIARAQPAPAC